jgi:hypothetical protein
LAPLLIAGWGTEARPDEPIPTEVLAPSVASDIQTTPNRVRSRVAAVILVNM